MKELKCIVYDEDKFTKGLITSFIDKIHGIQQVEINEALEADIVYVDASLVKENYLKNLKPDAQIIIVSSNQNYIHSFFQNEIAEYINKSEISYGRILKSIENVRIQLGGQ